MSRALLLLARKMAADDIPAIDIPLGCRVNNSRACVSATQDAIEECSSELLQVYKDWYSATHFRIEDVIDYVVRDHIDELIYFTGFDIAYVNKTIHIRFGILGEDILDRHGRIVDADQFDTKHLFDTVHTYFVLSSVSDREEYWDYTFDIK